MRSHKYAADESQNFPIYHEATTEEDGLTCQECGRSIRKDQLIVEFANGSLRHEDCESSGSSTERA